MRNIYIRFTKIPLKKKKGFTLMELLVSLGIIAALSMIMAPMIIGKVQEAKQKADISNAASIAMAVRTEILENGSVKKGDQDINDYIGDSYFDGKLPQPQSIDGVENFVISISNNKIVTVKAGETVFYPFQEDDSSETSQ